MSAKVVAMVGLATLAMGASQTGMQRRPEFDVASVKTNHLNNGVVFGANNGQAGGRNVTLKILIALAWRTQEFQISGGASWIGAERFDVEGKTEDQTADRDRLRLMLRSLLEDRFNLKLHREMRELPVYALVVGKRGPKIKMSPDQSDEEVNGPAPPGAGPNHGAIRLGMGSLTGNAVTLSLFSHFLTQRVGRTIIDKTNLKGRFDLQLLWTPETGENPFGPGGYALPPAQADGSRPSLFVAVQEQLGLKLVSDKAPVEILVIDHVERPTGN